MADSVLVGLCTLLLDYLDGQKTMRDCAEWLAGVDWDDPTLDAQTRRLLGRFELLTTEVGEGLKCVPMIGAAVTIGGSTNANLWQRPEWWRPEWWH